MKLNEYKYFGFLGETVGLPNTGYLKDSIIDKLDYNRSKILDYLEQGKRILGCPCGAVLEINTGEELCHGYGVYSDGVYAWPEFILHYIKNYNIKLPEGLIKRADAEIME